MKSSFREKVFSMRGIKSSRDESTTCLIKACSDDVTSVRSPQPDLDPDHKKLQEEVRQFLTRALHSQPCCSEEDYVRLYVDVVQFIRVKTAGTVSAVICDQVWTVCYKELQQFVRRFKQQQMKDLSNRAQTWKKNRKTLETIDFLKTLKTCKELRLHMQTAAGRIQQSLLTETVAELENMEAMTMKLLMDIIAKMTERNLKDYFRSAQKWLPLFTDLVEYFPERPCAADEQRLVIDKAYKIIARSYLTHLLQNSQDKLRRWSMDVGTAVSVDARRLHQTMENLAPGVQARNGTLLSIKEVLECEDTDGLKLTVALMKQDCAQHNADLDLLPKLLQWKGLSRQQVREVLDALPDAQPDESWWRNLTCCFSTCCQQQKHLKYSAAETKSSS